MRERYEREREEGVARSVVEYLFLPDFLDAVKRHGLFGSVGYPSKKQFDKAFSSLVNLRNQVAHPVKSLIDGPATVGKLWAKIEVIERALFRLRTVSRL